MKFSSSIEYAIHSLVYLSCRTGESPTLVADVAKAINVSEAYLRKVFQLLSRSSIVTSQRGAKGGFYVSRPAEEITLKDVVEAIDGSLPSYNCLKQQRRCLRTFECAVQREFTKAQEKMAEILDATSIASLAAELSAEEAATWLNVAVQGKADTTTNATI